MKPSIEKLHKFFKHEIEEGCENRAVIGGLAGMLDLWEAEARADSLPEEQVQLVLARLRDYHRLSPSSRYEVLQGLWRRLEGASGSLPPLKVKESAEPKPARQKPAPATALAAAPVPEPEAEPAGPVEPVKEERNAPAALPSRTRRRAPAAPFDPGAAEGAPAALNASITTLSGVGPTHARTLERLGLQTLGDILYFFPRRHDDYSQLKPINRLWYGDEVSVIATVQSAMTRPVRSGKILITEAVVSDGSGALRITWFNQPWITKRMRPGMHVVLSGKIDQYLGRLVMNNPELEQIEQQNLHTNRIVPVYPLTANITQKWLRKMVYQVVSFWAPRVQEPLPDDLLRSAGLMDLPTALLQMHFPDSQQLLTAARHRLAFDEIFLLQLGLLGQKRAWQADAARIFEPEPDWLDSQIRRLPYSLTAAQQRALASVQSDLASGSPMNRLLQGDVGSGKTVIAALAVARVARSGAQAAVMAPTSILAGQHFRTFTQILAGEPDQPPVVSAAGDPEALVTAGEPELPQIEPIADLSPEPQALPTGAATYAAPPDENLEIPAEEIQAGIPVETPILPPGEPILKPGQIRLMIGSTPEAEKREIREGLASGEIMLVIGTHALIEDPVAFADLQLAVIDEQHRFGVDQRAALRQKGANPHLLVMTATPIPRSLALTVYGDLDLSVIDEMPPGRQPVATFVLAPRLRERAYSLVRREAAAGRQTFIIYPLVEETEQSESEALDGSQAAVEEHARLQAEVFPDLKLGLLHGRLPADEKESVMERFRSGEIQVLVSTSVVEVGVDIPNATVMLVEGANRFGLAQLHQFRGRVGRGQDKAYCLLIPESEDSLENERLSAMAETNDGFVLAERDLEQRGPGQFLGTRQSGFAADLRLARLTDIRLVEKARESAQSIFEQDPELKLLKHRSLSAALSRYWGNKGDQS